ncbi:MAG: cytochrome P460 family protein [Acetobacteraceae bacterium]
MKAQAVCIPLAVLVVGAGVVALQAKAGSDLVKFPDGYENGVHYATVNRGNIREELFTSREAIDAVQSGQPLPSGTVITLADYRSGELFRIVVMEKRTGWGTEYPADIRNGEWEYQSFNPDRSIKQDGQPERCMACHKSQEQQDFVWTISQMKSAR